MPTEIAVLFARADSTYHTLPGCDVWDAARDARLWPGGCPVVAHPPCRAWGKLRHFARPEPGETDLALLAVAHVRQYGGVLEHPVGSLLWTVARLPVRGQRDEWGGWTLAVSQHWWGHRAEKKTVLYIVGCEPRDVPPIPYRIDQPTHVLSNGRMPPDRRRPELSHADRERTPPEFAAWLCELARRCRKNTTGKADKGGNRCRLNSSHARFAVLK